ncbi:MAG: ribbon-helix-helix domain-containing protein [Acidimicrobiales bacterium]
MKVAVSVPEELYGEADRLASERGMSRSELYARALRRFLDEEGSDAITRRIDETCDQGAGEDLAPVALVDLLGGGLWEW